MDITDFFIEALDDDFEAVDDKVEWFKSFITAELTKTHKVYVNYARIKEWVEEVCEMHDLDTDTPFFKAIVGSVDLDKLKDNIVALKNSYELELEYDMENETEESPNNKYWKCQYALYVKMWELNNTHFKIPEKMSIGEFVNNRKILLKQMEDMMS